MEQMKDGARVITLKMPESDQFGVLERGWFKMSWGKCTVYVLKRKPRAATTAGAGSSTSASAAAAADTAAAPADVSSSSN
jgi:hypothetical protein